MTTVAIDDLEAPLSPARPTLSSVEIGEWPGLGNNVRLELGERRTVLVGRNGAGKSLLVAGVFRSARETLGGPFRHRQAGSPAYFRCEVRRPGLTGFAYEYRRGSNGDDDNADAPSGETLAPGEPRIPIAPWTERCWELATGAEVWSVSAGILKIHGDEPAPIPPGFGLLEVLSPLKLHRPPSEALALVDLLFGFALIPAGVPRSDPANRGEIFVPRSPVGARRWSRTPGRINGLADTLLTFYESRRELFDEFVGLARQLRLVREVIVKVYEDPEVMPKPEERRDFASILFDGVNIGLLSDGTLRITEMLIALIRRTGSVVLIEEPETAVHPGLLSRLLDVFDSYSADRQVVVSTHSPRVVDWCRPDELRLIERVDAHTAVRSLSATETTRVAAYLSDEGSLSDFIYSQASE